MEEIKLGEWDHSPEIKEICRKTITEVSENFLASEKSGDWLDYAPLKGHDEYRTSLAEFLTDQYGSEVSSSDLIPTYGATYGLLKLANLFFNAGSLVFCENPLYGPSITLLRDLGMNLIPVTTDSDGIIVDELEAKLKQYMQSDKEQQTLKSAYSAMLYLIPVIQNPTGTVLSIDRCERIVQLARKYNLLVACDDVYNVYFCSEDATGHPPPRLFTFDKKTDSDYGIGHVVSNGTFSKILVPSLRIGWLEAPNYVIDKITVSGQNVGAGSPAGYMQGLVTTAIDTGKIKEFMLKSKAYYKVRLDFFVSLLKKYFPKSANYCIPKGGFFIWISLPESFSTKKLSEVCAEKGIIFNSGSNYSVDGSFDNCVRLCPSMATEQQLEFAVKTIAEQIAISCQ